MNKRKIRKIIKEEIEKLLNEIVRPEVLKGMVKKIFNDWDMVSISSFAELEDAGVIEEIEPEVFMVYGGVNEKLIPVDYGDGLYEYEWEYE